MVQKCVAIAGVTGLIGSELLRILENDPQISEIRMPVRRPFSGVHPKVKATVVDFEDEAALGEILQGCDAVFCAIGTTSKKEKGNKDTYRKVDVDIPVRLGRICHSQGIPALLVVSSIGADAGSSNYYLQFKGEMEQALQALHLPKLVIVRPSMLLGKRAEFRPMEILMWPFIPLMWLVAPSAYKPIYGKSVARSMVAALYAELPGTTICMYRDMQGLIRGGKV